MIAGSWRLNCNRLRLLECWGTRPVYGGFSTEENQQREHDVWK